MDPPAKTTTSLFDVYLRLRPPHSEAPERFLGVDEAIEGHNTHITLKPPSNDHRKRAIEKFAFTRVFDEDATQLDVFHGTTIQPLIEGVLGQDGRSGRDGLLATLGVTGSGKSHTILGTKSQRGLTQMTLDVLFKTIGNNILRSSDAIGHLAASDVSEAQLLPASDFFQSIYGGDCDSRVNSRAQTPMTVSTNTPDHPSSMGLYKSFLGLNTTISPSNINKKLNTIKPVNEGQIHITRSVAKMRTCPIKDSNWTPIVPMTPSRRAPIPRPSNLPRIPSVSNVDVLADKTNAQYAVVVSMYEVYNDRIFDLLTGTASCSKIPAKDLRRRPLLFKSTEYSPDRKVVAGLRKVVCENFEEALLVLETGLTERRVAGTGSNAVSSRSHGFICLEVKKKSRSGTRQWSSSTLTIVDLAGSERARTAKTAGATLAEAGKINESLMYLGQCMQMQSDNSNAEANASHAANIAGVPNAAKPSLVPFRQCKLTELLFSNSFAHHQPARNHQNPAQKAIMIVTADPGGDFNATSQILRYSALAREVTVPRIPSVTSTILANTPTTSSRPTTAEGDRSTEPDPSDFTRMAAELALLREHLAQETQRRREAEASWARAEARLEDIEVEVREECWSGFEEALSRERDRWAQAWTEERGRVEGFADKKVEVLVRGLSIEDDAEIGEDAEVWRDRAEMLERENETLMEKVNGLEREKLSSRTPSRKVKVLKTRAWNMEDDEEDQENRTPL